MTEAIVEKVKIVEFDEITANIEQLKADNGTKVFDYDSKDGNKLARSHVATLKKRKAAIEKIRKVKKAASLAYGKSVDSQAKELTAHVVAMIAVHQEPLDAVAAREDKRVQELEEIMKAVQLPSVLPATSGETQELLDEMKAVIVDESFAERREEAQSEQDHTLRVLADHAASRKVSEAEAVELEQLRKEKAEREAADEKAAEEKVQAQNKRDREELEAKELKEAEARRIEEDKTRNEYEAKRIKEAEEETARKIKQEIADKEKADKEAEEKRKADESHTAKVLDEVARDLMIAGVVNANELSKALAERIANALMIGEIRHVTMKF